MGETFDMRRKSIFTSASIALTSLILSTTAFAGGEVYKDAGDEFSGHPAWNKWVWDNSTLEFHGYNRVTAGGSSGGDGDTQAKFSAPGAGAAYRLGNEPDFNFEFALGYKYFLDGNPLKGGAKDSRYVGFGFRIDEFKTADAFDDIQLCLKWETDTDCQRELAETYLTFGNFLGSGTELWFGRRWGQRLDIHMNDYYWKKEGQGSNLGGGVTGINIGGLNLDVNAYYYKDKDIGPKDADGTVVEARLGGINLFGKDSKLTLIGQIADQNDGGDADYSDASGFAVGALHELGNVYGGRWNLFALYRDGAGLINGDLIKGANLDGASSFEIGSDLYVEPGGDWALQWATVYKVSEDANGGETDWFSTGVRPIYYLSNKWNIALETGIDYVDNSNGANGNAEGLLWKNTVALQWTTGRGYFNRPVVRLFGTYASWDDDLQGSVGDAPGPDRGFLDDTDGFTFGVQFETWW